MSESGGRLNRREFMALSGLAAISVMGLAGCHKEAPKTDERKQAPEGEKKEGTTPVNRVVTDHTGRSVTLPDKIERVIMTSLTPLPSVYCMYRGGPKDLVGMSPSSMAAVKNSYLKKVYPEAMEVDTKFYTGNQPNIEEIVARKPDVVLCNDNKGEIEQLQNAGLCVVAFSASKFKFNCLDTLNGWLDLLRQIFPNETNTEGIYEAGQKIWGTLQERVSKLTDEQKPKVLIVYGLTANENKVAGTSFGNWWANSCGGKNCVDVKEPFPLVSMEQIYKWDPDMIFLNNFCPYLPEDLYNNAVENQDWSNVRAVKEKKVYKVPLGTYRWCPPSADSAIALYWFAKTMQPEVFKDIDMDKELKEYYKRFYKFDLTDEDLKEIYNPPREAAK